MAESNIKPGYVVFSIDVCPHGVYSLSVNGRGGGTRLLGPKCCGKTSEWKTWGATADAAGGIAEEIQGYADDAKEANRG